MAICAVASSAPSPVSLRTQKSCLRGKFSSSGRRGRIQCSSMAMAIAAHQDPYLTLGISSGASEDEIKRARRRLALQFHPDVCKSDSCTGKFIQIEKAYETIMDCLHGEKKIVGLHAYDDVHEGMMGVHDDSWEDWEEWMGWEGAGIRDYTSHINHSV